MLGRRALDHGLGILDMLAIHQHALARLLPAIDPAGHTALSLAGGVNFLAESLSPFEMAQRGFQDTLTSLKTLNEQLEAEIEKRTRALRESELQYRTLVDISPDAITLTGLDGKILLCNQQAAVMYGYASPEELIYHNEVDLVVPEDVERARQDAQRALEVDIVRNREYTQVRKDGTRFPVEASLSLIRDAGGEPRALIAIARDITERRQSRAKLAAQTRQQAAVADLGQKALAGADLSTLIGEVVSLVTNTIGVEFCELLEFLPDEDALILRAGAGWKDGLVGTARVKGGAGSQAGYTLLSAEPVVVADLRVETRFTPPPLLTDHGVISGMTVIIHGKGQPYGILGAHTAQQREFTKDESDFFQSVANVLAMAVDNLRLIETEARARREAERANEIKLRFLAMISHELRTPLTSIKGFATTLLADDVEWDAAAQRDFVETIDEEADKLYDLIEQLLDLSRLEAGTLRITPSNRRLESILGEVMAQLQELTRDHQLALDIPKDLPDIHADPHRIGQVIANLVDNAAKYSPPGMLITVTARAEGEYVRVDVADQGPGIPPEERERVFEIFHRASTRTSRLDKGAGLGLAICQGLIQAHGGRIWVQDRDAPGAVISFTVPSRTGHVREGSC